MKYQKKALWQDCSCAQGFYAGGFDTIGALAPYYSNHRIIRILQQHRRLDIFHQYTCEPCRSVQP